MQPAPAPDATHSRGRLTLWTLLLRTASVWARHLVPFTVVGLIVDLPIAAIALRGPGAGGDIVTFVLLWFLLWFLRVAGTAAVSVGVLQALAGERATIAGMLAVPARHLWPIFAAGCAYSALVVLGGSLVIPGLFVLAAGYLTIPAVVAEPDMGTEAALRRSFVLTEGHRLQLLIAFALLFGLEQAASYGLLPLLKPWLASSPAAGIAVELAIDALLCGLTSCSFAVAYRDLRVEKGMSPPRLRTQDRD